MMGLIRHHQEQQQQQPHSNQYSKYDKNVLVQPPPPHVRTSKEFTVAEDQDDADVYKKKLWFSPQRQRNFKYSMVILLVLLALTSRGYHRRQAHSNNNKSKQKKIPTVTGLQQPALRAWNEMPNMNDDQDTYNDNNNDDNDDTYSDDDTYNDDENLVWTNPVDWVSDSLGKAAEGARDWLKEPAESVLGKDFTETVGGALDAGLNQMGDLWDTDDDDTYANYNYYNDMDDAFEDQTWGDMNDDDYTDDVTRNDDVATNAFGDDDNSATDDDNSATDDQTQSTIDAQSDVNVDYYGDDDGATDDDYTQSN